jgi:hypothetical protein
MACLEGWGVAKSLKTIVLSTRGGKILKYSGLAVKYLFAIKKPADGGLFVSIPILQD